MNYLSMLWFVAGLLCHLVVEEIVALPQSGSTSNAFGTSSSSSSRSCSFNRNGQFISVSHFTVNGQDKYVTDPKNLPNPRALLRRCEEQNKQTAFQVSSSLNPLGNSGFGGFPDQGNSGFSSSGPGFQHFGAGLPGDGFNNVIIQNDNGNFHSVSGPGNIQFSSSSSSNFGQSQGTCKFFDDLQGQQVTIHYKGVNGILQPVLSDPPNQPKSVLTRCQRTNEQFAKRIVNEQLQNVEQQQQIFNRQLHQNLAHQQAALDSQLRGIGAQFPFLGGFQMPNVGNMFPPGFPFIKKR